MAELTIVIVSYNTLTELQRCLQSLLHAPPRITHQIVVVDNGSKDGSREAVTSYGSRVRLIALDNNVGFARANNTAFRATQSELVLLLNSDTIVPTGAIDALVQQLRELPGATVVGPRLVDASGAAELSFGRMMSPLSELRQKFLVKGRWKGLINQLTSRTRVVDWVSAACLLVRRADAETAGLFDERYFMYCEDVDFCAALRARGGRIYFTPAAEIVHLRGRSAAVRPAETEAAYRASQLAFYEKHHPAWAPALRLYLALRGKLRSG